MRSISRYREAHDENIGERFLAVDTSFVLFFLAVEFGRTFFSLSVDNVFLFLTLLAVAILPYFIESNEKDGFADWFFGRTLIAGLAIAVGVVFKQSLGVVLPEMMRFVPMTLLLTAAILCCYVQFYGFLKLRLAK